MIVFRLRVGVGVVERTRERTAAARSAPAASSPAAAAAARGQRRTAGLHATHIVMFMLHYCTRPTGRLQL